jgi:pyruvate dehydrogenase E1 component alpha subunit
VLAVYQAVHHQAMRARRMDLPWLNVDLRQCGHSRSDPRTYRSRDEEELWKERDPIVNFHTFLITNQFASPDQLAEIDSDVEQAIKDAIAYAESSPEPLPEDVYTDVFLE